MNKLDRFFRFFMRFRYPVSLPIEVAEDLGIPSSQLLTLEELLNKLSNPNIHTTRLKKFMERFSAEKVFRCALRKEHFKNNSIYSYYFRGFWMEFVLTFDHHSRLRRVHVQYQTIQEPHGIELPLSPSAW